MAEHSKHSASQHAFSRVGSPFGAKRSFSFPHEVVDDPSLNEKQKRSILCEWASDASAVESFPTLRLLPGTSMPVTLSAVFDALRQLDIKYAQDAHVATAVRPLRVATVTKIETARQGLR